ncbi:MAG: ribosome recycling factor [Thermodesulfobacteriota bacterium]
MKETIIKDARAKMDKAVDAYRYELTKLRTGRASIAIFDGLSVDYYGTPTPLNQMATVSVPEARQITVQPWDISQLAAIEKAIIASDLGLTPGNDGKIIRINIPPLTEDRRKELVKIAKKYTEECRVSIRNSRRDANEAFKKGEKDKEISQDDLKKGQSDVQHLTDKEIAKVDEVLSNKEKEIMEI